MGNMPAVTIYQCNRVDNCENKQVLRQTANVPPALNDSPCTYERMLSASFKEAVCVLKDTKYKLDQLTLHSNLVAGPNVAKRYIHNDPQTEQANTCKRGALRFER
jgi:hypothetical protein